MLLILAVAPPRIEAAPYQGNVQVQADDQTPDPADDPALRGLFRDAIGKEVAGQYAESAVMLEKVWTTIRASHDKSAQAMVLSQLAMVYFLIEPDKGFTLSEQALAVDRQADYAQGEAPVQLLRARYLYSIGQPQPAMIAMQEALRLFRDLKDKEGEAETLDIAGVEAGNVGQLQQAFELMQQSAAIYRELGSKAGEGAVLNHIGQLYLFLGQPGHAADILLQAVQVLQQPARETDATPLENIAQATLVGQGLAQTLYSLGLVLRHLGRPQAALDAYDQALQKFRAAGLSESEASVLNDSGECYLDLNQPQRALEYMGQALAIYKQLGNRQGIGTTLYNIGVVYSGMGQPRQARGYYDQALPVLRSAASKQGEAMTLAYMAFDEAAQGQTAAAATHMRAALGIVENVRGSLGSLSTVKVGFLESYLGVYDLYIDLLLRQNKEVEAFTWMQKTKARALVDLMSAGKVDINRGLSRNEASQQQKLTRIASQLNQQLVAEAVKTNSDRAQLNVLKQRLADADSALQRFTDELYTQHPLLARKRAARTVQPAEIAQFLPADTALLDYVQLTGKIGKKTLDKTVLFCVTVANGKAVVRTYPVPADTAALGETTSDFRDACTDPGKNYRVKARDLYRLLIAPAAPQLAGKRRLIICPDGPLWGLPFQALIHKDEQTGAEQFLTEQYEVDYAYSATAAQAALETKADPKRTRPTGTLLALANPAFGGAERLADGNAVVTGRPIGADARPIGADARPIGADSRDIFTRDGAIKPLPGTQREAEAIKADFPDSTIEAGAAAQESVVKQNGAKYRYLHFATHGLFNDAAPMLSSVVLAAPPPGSPEDGFLMAREIFDLNLNADMAVLSACNTARGETRSGEGVVGLTWALFVAGVPTQVVSQWAVNDSSTADLMQQFYGHLKQGETKGAALRAAELALLKDGQHSHPYYWAPFVLIGDWGK